MSDLLMLKKNFFFLVVLKSKLLIEFPLVYV